MSIYKRLDCINLINSKDVKKICQKLKIEVHKVEFIKEYWNKVFQNTIDDYRKGLTPSPDIYCKSFFK
jgi:tRNA-uridine 2-sulfurtransferase